MPLTMKYRSVYTKLLALGSLFTFLLLVYTITSTSKLSLPSFSFGRAKLTCSPHAYADGKWVYKPRTNRTAMVNKDDVLEFAGLEGCASSREFYWHLASDKEEQWDRFPVVNSWEWKPKEECRMNGLSSEALVRDLVEKGGWLILGDSVSENHFFSISCSLYPHVRATPNYIENPYFDRAWPQNLYLNPSSPLVQSLSFPSGFNISGTPLITFRRVDLLLENAELIELHRSLYNPPENFTLFSEEAVWNLSPEYYMDLFTSPLPESNYGTLVVSTGGHWTTTLMSGYRDESKSESGYGIDGVIEFFGYAMERWADEVQRRLNEVSGPRRGVVLGKGGVAKREVVVRAYLPGHEDCHNVRKPWEEVQPFVWNWYNWGNIGEFNEVFERTVSKEKYPNIHYLGIDRPARLRPDAHATGDCLHIMTGAGVLEGWTHYIWHFVTHELGFRVRGA